MFKVSSTGINRPSDWTWEQGETNVREVRVECTNDDSTRLVATFTVKIVEDSLGVWLCLIDSFGTEVSRIPFMLKE